MFYKVYVSSSGTYMFISLHKYSVYVRPGIVIFFACYNVLFMTFYQEAKRNEIRMKISE